MFFPLGMLRCHFIYSFK